VLSKEKVIARNNIHITGSGPKTLLLAHGFGCDQEMWRFLTPDLEERYTLVLLDYVGSGRSELSAFSESRYAGLEGYARDVNEMRGSGPAAGAFCGPFGQLHHRPAGRNCRP